MAVSIVSHNSICNEGVARACRDRGLEVSCQRDSIGQLDAASACDVLLWHFTADDPAPRGDIQAFARARPDVRIVALAPNAMCGALEAHCGNLLSAVLPESTLADAVVNVLRLAEEGYQIRRKTTPPIEPLGPVVAPPEYNRTPLAANGHCDTLSRRETSVLQCLSAGYSNKSIARALGICDATVKAHLRSSFRRIGATNRTQAALWASKYLGDDQTSVR